MNSQPTPDSCQRDESGVFLILAGNYKHAQSWARRRNLPSQPSYRNKWIYMKDARDLLGISKATAFIHVTFYDRTDWFDLFQEVQALVDCGKIVWPDK